MWNNLIGIFYIFYTLWNKKIELNIQKTLIFSWIWVALIWFWEYFHPSHNYGELSNRLLSTFWHPNYVALYLLLIIPLLYYFIQTSKNIFKKYSFYFIFILISCALFFTKSIVAIFILVNYILYIFYSHNRQFKWIILWAYILWIIWSIFWILQYYPEKIPSFLSRFYIWETTLKIIFSDLKIFLFWIWLENLPLLFDNFKSIELYIFENIWYVADRPHNIILSFFVHFWIWWLVVISSFYYYILKNIKSWKWYNISLFFASLFLLFHFASIVSYLIIILLFIYSLEQNSSHNLKIKWYIRWKIFVSIIACFSFASLYFSPLYYQAEIFIFKKEYKKASETFHYNGEYFYKIWEWETGWKIEKFKSEKYYLSQIYNTPNIQNNCKKLIEYYSSAENYLYCWELLERMWFKEDALIFYKLWVEKLPDLRNLNSPYYNHYLIRNFSSLWRFLSPKYSDLEEILHKVWK